MSVNKEVLEELLKAKSYQEARWLKVIARSREYAQLKLHGSYVDCSGSTVIAGSSRDHLLQRATDDLLREIESAFLEDALLGAAVMDATRRDA